MMKIIRTMKRIKMGAEGRITKEQANRQSRKYYISVAMIRQTKKISMKEQ